MSECDESNISIALPTYEEARFQVDVPKTLSRNISPASAARMWRSRARTLELRRFYLEALA
jgi:hypothetical protein